MEKEKCKLCGERDADWYCWCEICYWHLKSFAEEEK